MNILKTILFLVITALVTTVAVLVGIQIGKNQKNDYLSTSKKPDTTSLSSPTTPTEKPIISNALVSKNTNCFVTFTSKYLDLNFKYDNCTWIITEQKGDVNSGNSYYSMISAVNNKTSNKVLIKAENIGMGGGYPRCENVNNITQLEGSIVRIKMQNSTYLYLNEKNDYAIKGNTGKFGDVKFSEYFSFLNPQAFPNANMCWRTTGINPVLLLNPNANEEQSKDITLSVEDFVSDDIFFEGADSLAVSVYSSITK